MLFRCVFYICCSFAAWGNQAQEGDPLSPEKIKSLIRFTAQAMSGSDEDQTNIETFLNKIIEVSKRRATAEELRERTAFFSNTMPHLIGNIMCAFEKFDELARVSEKDPSALEVHNAVEQSQEYKDYIQTYLALVNFFLGDDVREMRKTPAGIHRQKEICWVTGWKNNPRQPIIFHYDKSLQTAPVAAWWLPKCFASENGLQKVVVMKRGEICQDPGVFSAPSRDEVYDFFLYAAGGAPSFELGRLAMGTIAEDLSFARSLHQSLNQDLETTQKQLKRGMFFPLPQVDSEDDEMLFQAALLEAIADEIEQTTQPLKAQALAEPPRVEVIDDETSTVRNNAQTHQKEVKAALKKPQAATYVSDEPQLTTAQILREQAKAIYEDLVRREWNQRQRDVVQGTTQSTKASAKGKKTKQPTQAVVPEPAPTAYQPKKEDVSSMAQKGRMKFRETAKIISTTIKDAVLSGQVKIDVSSDGSHRNFHIKTAGGEDSGGVTLVDWHGGRSRDQTVPASRVNNLVGQISDLIGRFMNKAKASLGQAALEKKHQH